MSEQGLVTLFADLEELRKAVEAGRKREGLSIRHLAELCGVTPNVVNKFLNGFAPPSEQVLVKVAGLLHLDADWCLAKAGRVPADVKAALVADPGWFKLIRAAKYTGKKTTEFALVSMTPGRAS